MIERADGLVGQVRDRMIETIKASIDWDAIPELKQKMIITDLEKAAEVIVADTIDVVLASGTRSIKCDIGSVKTHENTYQGSVSIARSDPDALDLIKASYGTGRIVVAPAAEAMMDKGETPEPTPDQNSMFNEGPKPASEAIGKVVDKVKPKGRGRGKAKPAPADRDDKPFSEVLAEGRSKSAEVPESTKAKPKPKTTRRRRPSAKKEHAAVTVTEQIGLTVDDDELI